MTTRYRQCVLESGDLRIAAYLPEEVAVIGTDVGYDHPSESGRQWVVTFVAATPLSAVEAHEASRRALAC